MDPAELKIQQALERQTPILEAMARGDSEIQHFYDGSTVFVTGATGFIGKVLLEKLIRACNIRQIYVLIRPKKGKEIDERINAFLKDNVFDTLRETQYDFGNKIVPLEGDVAEIRLGLSDQDRTRIIEQVDVIFHMAATTRFDLPLRQSTLINVRGTKEMVELGKQCKKLRSFVHVSTAFSQATRSRIKSDVLEQFYPNVLTPAALIGMAESMEDHRLNAITEKLTDGWPNTYTFTKAIAEDIIQANIDNLPACVLRPPVAAATEPQPGWIDPTCVNGAAGWLLSVGIGLCHVVLKDDVKMCFAPVDYVANAIIAAGRETYKRHEESDKESKIYTISSGSSFDSGFYGKYLRNKQSRSLASPKSVWYCGAFETKNKFLYWIIFWVVHYIPAYIVDTLLFFLGVKLPEGITSIAKVYTKMYNTTLALSFFLLNDWNFNDVNTVDMYNRMSITDKALFNFNMKQIDWNEQFLVYMLGIRKYIIKDGLKNTAHGVRMQFWFKIATYIILPLYAYFIFKIFHFFYNSVTYVI